jgi:glycosyltransferase involved in cell wall biosynthesis
MKLLFVHQNCPGQYKHLAPRLAADPGNQVVFITKPGKPELPKVRKVEYTPARSPRRSTHHYLRQIEDGVLNGQGAVRAAMELKRQGFTPDVICAHMGWGEGLYLKDVWPQARLLGYFEFFYHAFGADADFARDEPQTLDDVCRTRSRNGLHLLSLDAADWGISPTRWQWQQHPEEFRQKISVIHDGVDARRLVPDPRVSARLRPGIDVQQGEEIVTYVARNLEPYRGFKTFMKAAELILKRRPGARILVVGADGVSYGRPPADGRTWRQVMMEQVDLDRSRIHFLGRVSYDQFVKVLQLSAAHIYLTVPFVLSWSMLEAMAAQCLVIGSRTPPVEEVIEDGRNGLLVDFFSAEEVADAVDRVLEHPDRMKALRERARKTVLEQYDLSVCLPRQVKLIQTLAAGRRPLASVPGRAAPVAAAAPAAKPARPARQPQKRRR